MSPLPHELRKYEDALRILREPDPDPAERSPRSKQLESGQSLKHLPEVAKDEVDAAANVSHHADSFPPPTALQFGNWE